MRVLQVTDFYWPDVGGVEQHVRSLSHALARRGHQVTVATQANDPSLATVEHDGPVEVVRLRSSAQRLGVRFADDKRPWAPPVPDPLLALELRRLARSRRANIVHGHDWMARSAWLAGRQRGTGVVLTFHYFTRTCAIKTLMRNGAPCPGPSAGRCLPCTAGHYGRLKGPLVYLSNRFGAAVDDRLATSFIAVSSSTAALNGPARPGTRWEVVPNLLADALGPPSDAAVVPGLPDGPFVVYVGDLRQEKGVEVLFEAYRREPSLPALVLVGKQTRGELAAPAGATRIGPLPNEQVRSVLGLSLAAIVPSVWPEPFSVVAIEAMAAGTPVVASTVGGLADVVVEGETGILVPPGDPVALGKAIDTLAKDKCLRERLGESAREHVRRYDPDLIAAEIEQIYERAIRARA